jgi:uncharacterized membrane protein HdeD (DUF308 family)
MSENRQASGKGQRAMSFFLFGALLLLAGLLNLSQNMESTLGLADVTNLFMMGSGAVLLILGVRARKK